MERRIAAGLVLAALVGFAIGAAAGALAAPAMPFLSPGRDLEEQCAGEFDIRDADRLMAAVAFVEEQYGVTMNAYVGVVQMAAATGLPPAVFLQADEGREPALLYNYAPLGGCLIVDFTPADGSWVGILVFVRPAGEGWEIVREQRYAIR